MSCITLLPFVLPSDLEVFNALQSSLLAAVQPQGVFEQFAFERLVKTAWDMRRVSSAELSLVNRTNGEDPLTHPDTADDARRFAALTRQMESS
jgi:hypothetical protein